MGTRSVLDTNLTEIRDDILRLGSLVNQAVERSIVAFSHNDMQMAQEVVEGDDAIDSLHHKLEERIISTVALQQPMAHDLRRLIAALLITNELERMGDYAEGIGRTALRRGEAPEIHIPARIGEMQKAVNGMISAVMDAYLNESPEQAQAVSVNDDKLDGDYKEMFNELVGKMGKGQLPIEHGAYLMWAAHNLERIGDRVTNICERIVYSKTGEMGGLNPKGSKP
jgi:phosphate transport system protein